jgi:hypothetical protein
MSQKLMGEDVVQEAVGLVQDLGQDLDPDELQEQRL